MSLVPADAVVFVSAFQPFGADLLGTRDAWGECWWTARDLCLSNQPKLQDPLQAMIDAHDEALVQRMLFGVAA